jgi:nitrate/nitrite transporter NarK
VIAPIFEQHEPFEQEVGRLTNQQLACDLLAFFCASQGAATLALDLNRTHAANPLWLHHARFHVVWQASTTAALAGVELALLFAFGPIAPGRFYLVLALAGMPVFGFFAALFSRRIYGGTLSDPNGIRPLRIRSGKTDYRVDLNLVAEIAAIFSIIVILVLYRG